MRLATEHVNESIYKGSDKILSYVKRSDLFSPTKELLLLISFGYKSIAVDHSNIFEVDLIIGYKI